MANATKPPVRAGRRPSTSAAAISAAGIRLFTTNGFEETSVDDVADAAGIARRTLFRYFPSKNAIPWGDFDAHLDTMRAELAALPEGITLAEGLRRALLHFNTFPPEESPTHRSRMALILEAPALQGYSMLMYTGWRQVIAEYVATRLGLPTDAHLPQLVGWTLLGVAICAYERWLADDSADLLDLLDAGSQRLAEGIGTLGCKAPGIGTVDTGTRG